MSVASGTDTVRLEDAGKLASYLRLHPDAHDDCPDELAQRFGLPVPFVESVLRSLDGPARQASTRPALSLLKRAVYQMRLLFRRLTHEPTVFIIVTTAASIALFLILENMFGAGLLVARQTRTGTSLALLPATANGGLFLSVAFATMALHQACYFRHGKVRYALLGAVWAWVISASTLMVIGWLHSRASDNTPVALQLLVLAYVMFVLCALYACFSVVTSVLGGVYWVRKHEEAKERRSRQELLEHLFDLQKRLEQPESDVQLEEPTFWRHWTHRARGLFFPVALVAGVAFSIVEVSLILALGAAYGDGFESSDLVLLAEITFGFVRVFAISVVAYTGRTVLRAMLAALVFQYATIPITLIPVGIFGPHRTATIFHPQNLAMSIGVALIVGAIASLGAKVEERHSREQRLRGNEKAALIAEIVRTERQLSLQNVDVCVLVVDVAQSSKMKARANPLEVEYSFREYQRYVARICGIFGGSVHSTAGDGAVVAFYDCQNAYDAARKLQSDLAQFNAERNKLKSPFRIRIGLHLGQIAGDLGDIQFSEVIDIAAHIEAAAPIGGIALSHAVAEQLPGARLAQLAEKVSGHIAYISANPVEAA